MRRTGSRIERKLGKEDEYIFGLISHEVLYLAI
jgi:hypothetical protein